MGVQECVNSIENGCNSNEEEEERGNSSEELLLGGGGVKRTLHRSPSSVLRKKSDPMLLVPNKKDGFGLLARILANVQEVILGTKLFVLFPAVFLAILAQCNQFGRHWVFALSLLGLAPLAERISFLTEQIAFYTGPTVGGLLNATCGNATELIIAVLALHQNKILVVKFSLLGSILSNLLLVLGTSLLCGGLVNIKKQQTFCRKQADVNSLMLLLGLLCHMLPLILRYAVGARSVSDSNLVLSRASGIVMLVAYLAYLFFQLKTHRQLFDSEEGDEDEDEKAVVGFWSAFGWLLCMTVLTALLSEYVVGTIEDASESWGLSVRFISLIVLPIVGNAAEHAGAIIFAFKNKLDISMGVALGSATQVSMFVVPFSVLVGWVMGVQMDLDFSVLETGCLAFSVLLTALALQDGTSHYMKGVVLCLCYAVIGTCYFFEKNPFLKGQKAM